MAIFHYSIRMVQRSHGESAIAAAAYQARARIKDEETGRTHDYSRRKDLVYKEIMLCEHAPPPYQHRKTLWSAVQHAEKAKDAQLARRIEIALPVELSFEQQIELVRSYVQKTFVDQGMCADFCIHHPDKEPPNPHVHILLTTRGIRADGQWAAKERKEYELDNEGNRIPIIDPRTGQQKIGRGNRKMWKRITVKANTWNDRSLAEEWRAAWADAVNETFTKLGISERIDHRSYIRQGIAQIPTEHEGAAARKMESMGSISERCGKNRQIRKLNTDATSARSEEAELRELQHRKELVDERAKRLLPGGGDSGNGGISAGRSIKEERTSDRQGSGDSRFTATVAGGLKSGSESANQHARTRHI